MHANQTNSSDVGAIERTSLDDLIAQQRGFDWHIHSAFAYSRAPTSTFHLRRIQAQEGRDNTAIQTLRAEIQAVADDVEDDLKVEVEEHE